MKFDQRLFAAALGIALFVVSASRVSATNLIANPGFETGDLTGWTVINASPYGGVSVRSDENDPLAAGSFNAFASNLYSAAQIELQQSTPLGSAGPGTVNYSFDLRLDLSVRGGSFAVHIWDVNSGGGIIDQGPGLLQPNISADGSWHTFSGTFTAPSNVDHFEIEFDTSVPVPLTGSSAEIMRIDNVSISQVPEPSTISLVGLGLLGILKVLHRRRSGHPRR
jgi:hypothetical protein